MDKALLKSTNDIWQTRLHLRRQDLRSYFVPGLQ